MVGHGGILRAAISHLAEGADAVERHMGNCSITRLELTGGKLKGRLVAWGALPPGLDLELNKEGLGTHSMDPLGLAAQRYVPSGSGEQADFARIASLLKESDQPWSRANPLHVTGSALVVDRASGRVLLRWHERMAKWMQVGGHADPRERDPLLVAWREAREETGLPDLRPVSTVGPARPIQVVIVPVPQTDSEPAHEHADFRYVFASDRPNEALPESVNAPLRWMTIDAALTETTEDNLREFLRRVERFLHG